MDRHELQRLARLGASARLEVLMHERAAILRAFPDLRDRKARVAQQRAVPRRRRRHMSAAARRAVSVRMKKYWAARRKKNGKAA